MFKFGFLGLGKMGSSILNGVLTNGLYKKEELAFYAPSETTRNKYTGLGLTLTNDEKELFISSKMILLAIKPQKYAEVFSKLNDVDFNKKTIISLAPGKSIEYLSNIFKNANIVRAMPNTPALIGNSVTTLCFKDEKIKEVLDIFSSLGNYECVKEQQIDESIPLNGSMPAFILEFAKTFISHATEYGIDRDVAYNLALNSIIGSCKLALNSTDDLDTLINNVCSKGGSTIVGLNELRNNGFNESIIKCYDACVKRSIELGKE